MKNEPNVDTEEGDLSRRRFVKIGLGGVGLAYAAAVGYPLYRYLDSSYETSEVEAAVKDVTLDKADSLAAGSVLMFKFGMRPAMLIHHKDGTWIALDAVCTHLGCTVKFDQNLGEITCACHGGKYDAKTGENISGPPPKPLRKYTVALNSGSVTVTRA